MYAKSNTDSIIRVIDNSFIPLDPANTDYQEYLIWLADGNTPEPVVQPPEVITSNWKVLVDTIIGATDILLVLSTNPLFSAIIGRLQTLRNSSDLINEDEPLIALWNLHDYSFSEEQVEFLNQLAIANNIPLVLSDLGKIRFSRFI
jgi:hypothetical protein